MPEFFEILNLNFNFDDESEETNDDVDYLKENGFDVKYLLGNLGSSLVFIVFYIFSYFILLLLKFIGKYSKK